MDHEFEANEVLHITINVLGPESMTQIIIPIPEQHQNSDCREAYAEGVADGVVKMLEVMQPGATYAREDLKLDGE